MKLPNEKHQANLQEQRPAVFGGRQGLAARSKAAPWSCFCVLDAKGVLSASGKLARYFQVP